MEVVDAGLVWQTYTIRENLCTEWTENTRTPAHDERQCRWGREQEDGETRGTDVQCRTIAGDGT